MSAPPSLVRGTKSSTPYTVKPIVNVRVGLHDYEIDYYNSKVQEVLESERPDIPVEAYLPDEDEWIDPHDALTIDESKAGQYLRLECDEWQSIRKTAEGNPYTPLDSEDGVRKAKLIIQTKSSHKPPAQSGERWTEHLSDNAKREIEKSSIYMNKVGKGYRTFATLTLTQEWRAQLEKWDQEPKGSDARESIGKLVTKFINVLQQRHRNGLTIKEHYRRNGKQRKGGSYVADGSLFKGRIDTPGQSTKWTPIKRRASFKIRAKHQPFQFIWVAECPTNKDGEKNPHIHILMNWHVRKDEFHAWSMWIEKTWGKGFAKLEKIRKPAAAACYMAKAARYITKGNTSDQGRIRGNRYNIARDARPPKSRLIGIYAADTMHKHLNNYLDLHRNEWPDDIWFHRYGFGSNNKQAWGNLLKKILNDGFQLKPPPMNLHATMLRNSCVKQWRKIRDHMDMDLPDLLN